MLKGLAVAHNIFGLFGTLFDASVYWLFAAAAAAVVNFPVKENAFVDGDVLVLGVTLQIHVHVSKHSTQIRV